MKSLLLAKDQEIEKLKSQLKMKNDEISALKEDKARILKEQMGTLNKISNQAIGGRPDGQFRIEDLDRVIFETFNQDLKKRLDFIGKILDWQRFGEMAQGAG